MVNRARIRLSSTDPQDLNSICDEIRKIADKTGVKLRGPVPLPTRRLLVPTRIHKRLMDVDPNERFLKRLMRIKTPDNIFIEIELV